MAITLADFTKIWASTSPLTPYSFSDSNYQEGWNFIGSTPPARQMWDSIQKQNDEKLKYIVDNFFPLSGGTITGDITIDGGAIVGNPLTLTADDGNNSVNLVLDPSGSATWNEKEVERVNASGTNYIRYESGLQLCWDNAFGGATSSGVSVTYPVPFVGTPVINVTPGGVTSTTSQVSVQTDNAGPTGFVLKTSVGTAWSAYFCRWFAIGWWK